MKFKVGDRVAVYNNGFRKIETVQRSIDHKKQTLITAESSLCLEYRHFKQCYILRKIDPRIKLVNRIEKLMANEFRNQKTRAVMEHLQSVRELILEGDEMT